MPSYNQIAKSYNELHGEEQEKKLKIIKTLIKVKKTTKILDVGCGTGISSDFNCSIIGIDPSEALLKQNKKPHIQGSAENLPFRDNEFDIVLAITSIHNFNSIEKGIKEMKRVGKKQFVFSLLKRSDKLETILKIIKENFRIKKEIEEEKDIILLLEK